MYTKYLQNQFVFMLSVVLFSMIRLPKKMNNIHLISCCISAHIYNKNVTCTQQEANKSTIQEMNNSTENANNIHGTSAVYHWKMSQCLQWIRFQYNKN